MRVYNKLLGDYGESCLNPKLNKFLLRPSLKNIIDPENSPLYFLLHSPDLLNNAILTTNW